MRRLAIRYRQPDTVTAANEVADSIIEHAEAITRLDANAPAKAFNGLVQDHVHAIRVLAAPFIARTPDREFYRLLKERSLRADGVFVHLPGGDAQLLVDAPRGQLKIDLVPLRQLQDPQRT